MNKKFKEELAALAKKHGLEVCFECCSCGEAETSDGPPGAEEQWYITIIRGEK